MSTATVVPSCMIAGTAAPGSDQPANAGTIRRWPVDEIGKNSVSPWTMPRTIASNQDKTAEPYLRPSSRRRSALTGLGVVRLLRALAVGLAVIGRRLRVALARLVDLLDRVLARVPALDLHLLLLQILVDREEVLDLVA